MAEKLRALGIKEIHDKIALRNKIDSREVSPVRNSSGVEPDKPRSGVGNALWIDVNHLVPKDSLGCLQNCLVGKWRKVLEPRSTMKEVESWAKGIWTLKGWGLVAPLHEDLIFFEFTLPKDAS